MKSTNFLKLKQSIKPTLYTTRKVNPLIKIFCEGETEKAYFDSLGIKYRVEIKVKVTKKQQKELIENAEKWVHKNKLDLNKDDRDSVWCIIDVESNKSHWTSKVIPKIRKFQNNKNKFVITSNPCFEIWYFLHFKYTTRKYTEKELDTELSKLFHEKYKKGKLYIHNLKDLNKAIKRAKDLIKFHKEERRDILDYESNPSTTMYKFIEKIKKK